MTIRKWTNLPLGLLFLCSVVSSGAQDQQHAAGPASPVEAKGQAAHPTPSKTCPVISAQPTEAEVMLARKAYTEAEAAYQAELAKDPGSEEAHLGLVRSLVGEDKVASAEEEAAKMLAAHPKSAIAEVASFDAAYRAAKVEAAYAHARAAAMDDLCEGRADTAIAYILDLKGYYARAAQFYQTAHRLRPNDEIVRRDWIDSLPRKRREEELARYMEGDHALSGAETRDYSNELEHLKARKPGECRVVSKSETTKTAMAPVFGDNTHPVAYGLDVSFNGQRRRMQIDTGASGILLTHSAARALKLEPEFRTKAGGVGDEGDTSSYLTHVHSIRIGDVEVSDCMVEVMEKNKLDVDGLIGMDVFRRWLVTLDYQNAEVRLAPLPPRPSAAPAQAKLESDPLPSDIGDETEVPHDRYVAPEMKDWLSIMRIGHEILLESRVKEGPSHYLIMDTGAQLSNLSVELGREAGKLHEDSNMQIMGISGKVKKVYATDRVPLRVENIVIPPTEYYSYDMTALSHDSGFELSGLLGLPTLQRLTISIDYRDNLLKLTYDPKHDVQRF